MDCFLSSLFKLMDNLEENLDLSLLTFAKDTNMREVLNKKIRLARVIINCIHRIKTNAWDDFLLVV